MNRLKTTFETSQAFEFVIGTLTIEEREKMQALMRADYAIRDEVRFWETILEPETDNLINIPPHKNTLVKIKSLIQHRMVKKTTSGFIPRLWCWSRA